MKRLGFNPQEEPQLPKPLFWKKELAAVRSRIEAGIREKYQQGGGAGFHEGIEQRITDYFDRFSDWCDHVTTRVKAGFEGNPETAYAQNAEELLAELAAFEPFMAWQEVNTEATFERLQAAQDRVRGFTATAEILNVARSLDPDELRSLLANRAQADLRSEESSATISPLALENDSSSSQFVSEPTPLLPYEE